MEGVRRRHLVRGANAPAGQSDRRLVPSPQSLAAALCKAVDEKETPFDLTQPQPPLLPGLLLLLSRFSRVRLSATAWTAATRLPRPWDSPGKNTGVGCHFLLQCMKVKSESEVAQSCPTLSDPMDRSLPDSSIHGIFHARVLEWGAIAFSDRLSC